MVDSNKELVNLLKEINAKLEDIKYDLKDIKNNLPKVPYYGDMLQDINRSIKDIEARR
jgi:hypothetical protein